MNPDEIRAAAAEHHHPRVSEVVAALEEGILSALKKADVSHQEFKMGIKFLAGVMEAKEIPLMLMVFLEAKHVFGLDEHLEGSHGTVLGPYFRDDAPTLERPYRLPMRPDEPGDPMLTRLTVTDLAGAPIEGANVAMWQADNHGSYSNFHPGAPAGNLRGRMVTDAEGRIEVEGVRPGPYPIPDQGPTGRLLGMLGRHSWRPAHLHFVIQKPGYSTLTAQLYFRDGVWVDSDCVNGVRDSLVIDPPLVEGVWRIDHQFSLRSAG